MRLQRATRPGRPTRSKIISTGGGGGGVISYIGQSPDRTPSRTSAALTVNYPVGTAEGDLLLLMRYTENNSAQGAISGWTLHGSTAFVSSRGLGVYSRVAGAETSVLMPAPGTVQSGMMVAYRGVTQVDDINVASQSQDGGSLNQGYSPFRYEMPRPTTTADTTRLVFGWICYLCADIGGSPTNTSDGLLPEADWFTTSGNDITGALLSVPWEGAALPSSPMWVQNVESGNVGFTAALS